MMAREIAKSALLATYFGRPGPFRWPQGVPLAAMFDNEALATGWLRAVAAPLPDALTWLRSCCSSGQLAQAQLALSLAGAVTNISARHTGTGHPTHDEVSTHDETGTRSDATARELPRIQTGGLPTDSMVADGTLHTGAPGTKDSAPGATDGAHGVCAPTGGRRLVLFDEFGSAWDESTARSVGHALCKTLRRVNLDAPPTTGGLMHQAKRCGHEETGCKHGASELMEDPPVAEGLIPEGLTLVLAGCHVACVGAGALEPDWIFEAASSTCLWFGQPEASRDLRCDSAAMAHELSGAVRTTTSSAAVCGSLGDLGDLGDAMRAQLSTLHGDLLDRPITILGSPTADASVQAGQHSRHKHAGVQSTVGSFIIEERRGLAGWHEACAATPAMSSPPASMGDGASVSLALPLLHFSLRPCQPGEWRRFRAFHYKSAKLSSVATTFLLSAQVCVPRAVQPALPMDNGTLSEEEAIDLHTVTVPAGFIATIPHSGKRSSTATAPPQRAHRTVVLPEWQGFGVGSRLSDAAAAWHARCGSDYYGQTVHPRFGQYRDSSPLWVPTEANHTTSYLSWLPRRLTGASHSTPIAVKRTRPKVVYAHRYRGAADTTAKQHLDHRIRFQTD